VSDLRRVPARDGTMLAVHTVGSGSPVLCVPGGPGRASVYLENLAGLDATHTLHLLDSRGSGDSELPGDRGSLAFPRLADDVEDVRAALSMQPADVLGHSAGCPVALLHAARHPDAVRRLVLVTPSGRPFGWPADDVDDIRRSRSDEPWYDEAAEAAEIAPTANPALRRELDRMMRPLWYGAWDERTQTHAAGADEQVSLRAAAGYVPGADYDPRAAADELKNITAAVLVVVGALDAMTGVSVADRFAQVLTDAQVAVIPGAGHFPWVDAPDAFREAVAGFLAD
jgi:pimeloyl-ACP methyl ester carboxylesterase